MPDPIPKTIRKGHVICHVNDIWKSNVDRDRYSVVVKVNPVIAYNLVSKKRIHGIRRDEYFVVGKAPLIQYWSCLLRHFVRNL